MPSMLQQGQPPQQGQPQQGQEQGLKSPFALPDEKTPEDVDKAHSLQLLVKEVAFSEKGSKMIMDVFDEKNVMKSLAAGTEVLMEGVIPEYSEQMGEQVKAHEVMLGTKVAVDAVADILTAKTGQEIPGDARKAVFQHRIGALSKKAVSEPGGIDPQAGMQFLKQHGAVKEGVKTTPPDQLRQQQPPQQGGML